MELCRLENVRKTYEMGEKISPLNEISLKIESGDFLAIEGPSGTGKSTLLYIMSGLLRPTEGSVFLQGHDILKLPDEKVTELRRSQVGYIFQETNLFQALTVEGNLRFVQRLANPNDKDESKINYLLETLGLNNRRAYLPSQLSVGQRRRLIIARALLNDPPLILADEPTNDLDDKWASKVIELLTEVVDKGGAVVMVTHNTHWAKRANKRYLMQEGRLILC